MAVIQKTVSKQRNGSRGSSASAGVCRTLFQTWQHAMLMIIVWLWVNGAEWLPPCLSLLSLSKESAISQLLLKYESGFETSWLIFCHGRFAEKDCKVWVLTRLIFHPLSVRNNGCAMLAVHIYFIFLRCFCAKSVYTKVKYVFCSFFQHGLVSIGNICSFGPTWCN